MVEIRKVVIPESLEDVTVEQLVKYLALDFSNEADLIPKVFSIFCNISIELLKLMSADDVEYIFGKIVQAVNPDLANMPLQSKFEMDGVQYGMIPNLDNMTFGEFIDLDTFITPAFEGEIKHEDAFRYMATLYRPIREFTFWQKIKRFISTIFLGDRVNSNYQIVDYDGNEDWMVMKKAPANSYLSSVAFFLRLRIELLRASLTYMEVVHQAVEEKSLVKSGDGTEASLALQQVISQAKKQLQDSPSPSVLLNLNLMQKSEQYLN